MMFVRFGFVVVLIAAQAACSASYRDLTLFEFRQRHMGVHTRLALYAPDEHTASRAARAAFDRISLLDSVMSDYRSDSELTRLSARAGQGPVHVSADLFHALSRAQSLARVSEGAFDVTSGPLVQLWRTSRRTGVLPSAKERSEAAARVGWHHVRLDSVARTVELLRPGMRLDLGGIAKGYAADEAIVALRDHGVRRALVEMGGDIVAGDPPPGGRGWRVQVAGAPPEHRTIFLARAAVSTSGDTEQFVEIDGLRYSHVVDPATGLGLRNRVAATVIAADGITADALSTLLGVLGPSAGERFIRTYFPGASSYVRQLDASGNPVVPPEDGLSPRQIPRGAADHVRGQH